uniref:Uncharacterized protein LOC108950678 n=1 Tax=Phallusia mammillata TaxID=59560 RepID=A0A6F9DK91_9ASCI|nr:uncharacterized protein LOC108950678 [Phallusia mammillata]
MCQIYTTSYESHYYFFGGKFHTKNTISAPAPTPGTCEEWKRTLSAPLIGRLLQKSDTLYSSNNQIKIEYKWPTSNVGSVNNAILTKSTIYYDPINKKLRSALGIMSSCNVHQGFCSVGTRTFVWTVPKNVDCAITYPIGTHEMIQHHGDSVNQPRRLEIPDLGLSIHHTFECPKEVASCYSPHAFCAGGIIVVPKNCTINTKRNRLDIMQRSQKDGVQGLILNEATDALITSITNMTNDIHYVECQIQSLLSTVYSLLSRQYPGEIISQVLGGHRAAITTSDLMTEITCEEINGTILHSLRHGDLFATRPLIEYIDSTGTRIVVQLYRDGFVYQNVKFLETYQPGRVLSFRIDEEFVVFDNYTLTHVDSNVHEIVPTLSPIHFSHRTTDYQSFMDEFPKSSSGIEDMNSMLMTLTEVRLHNEQLSQYMQSNLDPSEEADVGYITDKIDAATKNVFLHVISSITSPFINFLVTIALFLACFWGIVLTGIALKHYGFWVLGLVQTKLLHKHDNVIGDVGENVGDNFELRDLQRNDE